MGEEAKFEIFVDGSCAFCRALQSTVEPRDTRHRLAFFDYNDPAVAARAPFPRERLDEEMHVRRPDGSWAVGFAGWAAILRELPRWGWLGWLFGIFPFRQLGPGVYRWIARHRYRIPGFPPPCTRNTCAVPANRATTSASVSRPQPR
jgi:predicted DCC family thiol-disulfide oxidoreductase YuxK